MDLESDVVGRLPDFLVIGAPKAGTTALHSALAQDPELFMSSVREPKYDVPSTSVAVAAAGPVAGTVARGTHHDLRVVVAGRWEHAGSQHP